MRTEQMKLYINTENENVEPEAEIHTEPRGIIWGKIWGENYGKETTRLR